VLEHEAMVLELCVRSIYEACPRGLAFGVTSHGARSEVLRSVRMLHEGKLLAPTLPHLAHVRTPAYDLGNVPAAQRNRWVEPFREGIATYAGFKSSTLYPAIARFGVLELGRVAICSGERQVAMVGLAVPEGTQFSDGERARLSETAAAIVVPMRIAALVADEARDRSALDRLFESTTDALVATDARGEILRSSPPAVTLLRTDRALSGRITSAVRSAGRGTKRRSEEDHTIHVSLHADGEVAYLVALDGGGYVEPPIALTPRQEELVVLVEKGLTNQEIASAMALAPATIKTMLERLYKKAGVANRAELGSWARRRAPGSA
jgi:DNA-binding NarL/FixJ family response regulator